MPRATACERVLHTIRTQGVQRIRVNGCDTHRVLRGTTLMADAVADAVREGIGLVGSLMRMDTSNRTAFQVFAPGLPDGLARIACATNLVLLPDPATFQCLPWAPGTAWLQGQPWFDDAAPVSIDTRRMLRAALARLAEAGWGPRRAAGSRSSSTSAASCATGSIRPTLPGPASRRTANSCTRATTCLPTATPTTPSTHWPSCSTRRRCWSCRYARSLEIELGPSQVEAVFGVTDALTAADARVRSAMAPSRRCAAPASMRASCAARRSRT